jgi:hypothetical protein
MLLYRNSLLQYEHTQNIAIATKRKEQGAPGAKPKHDLYPGPVPPAGVASETAAIAAAATRRCTAAQEELAASVGWGIAGLPVGETSLRFRLDNVAMRGSRNARKWCKLVAR